MAEFHFVEDYEKLVDRLVAEHPLDEAMAIAVGGLYNEIGQIEADLLKHAGLRDGMAILDMGCGSGRLAHALGKTGMRLRYTGVDIVQKLLDYAATKSPPHYLFLRSHALAVPAETGSLDFLCAFSLFTHLLHHETYLYMEDIHRALKPGGKLVFSFLEFGAAVHWPIFIATVNGSRTNTSPHLNSFIERSAIQIWSSHLGFIVDGYIEPGQAVSPVGPLGQTTVILQRAA